MPSVKTAISLDHSLFEEADRTAREMRVPRSRIISLALEEFLRKRRAQQITDRLNRVYANGPTEEEKRVQKALMAHLRARLKDEKW